MDGSLQNSTHPPLHHPMIGLLFIDHAKLAEQALYLVGGPSEALQHRLACPLGGPLVPQSPMLAAIQSRHNARPLSMEMDGTYGQPAMKYMGVRKCCPLSPMLSVFFSWAA